MFLVVFGHVATISMDSHTVFTNIFLTFRMPMFFFISGFIGYKAIEYWNVGFFLQRLKMKAFVQLIPLIIFLSLFVFTKGYDLLLYIQHNFGWYWFTFVLFEMFVIYYTLSAIAKSTTKRVLLLGLPLLSIFGIIYLSVGNRSLMIYHVMCWENLFKYFQFFTLGLFCKMFQTKFQNVVSNNAFKTTIIPLFVILFCIIHTDGIYRLVYSALHDVIIRYVGVFMVFMLFYSIRDVFDTDNRYVTTLKFIGRRTLDIYLIHFFFLPDLKYLEPFVHENNRVIIEFLIYTFFSASVIAMSLSVSWIIGRSQTLAYWCFGTKPKK